VLYFIIDTLKGIVTYQIHNTNSFSEEQILQIIQNIACALRDLHNLPNSPIIHRNISVDTILIGGDGCFKLGYFGSAYKITSELLAKTEVPEFEKTLNGLTKIGLRPPEFKDFSKGVIVTPKADIWQLGLLLDFLMTLGGFYKPAPSEYSLQLLNLRKILLHPNPRERPTALEVIRYIAQKDTLSVPGIIPDEAEYSTAPGYALNQPDTRSFLSGVAEKFTKYINKTGTKGWVISATENIDTEPKHKYVRKLITKAWEKPDKIIKFYTEILDREIIKNTVITLKSCITLLQYIFHGPIKSIHPDQNAELPLITVRTIRADWENILMTHEPNSADYYRSENLTKLIISLAEFLEAKIKLFITFGDTLDCSYAPLIQLVENAKLPLEFELVKSLLELLKLSNNTHNLLLETPKHLWNIRIGAALAIGQEENGIISILVHIIKTMKIMEPSETMKNSNYTYFINSAIEEFSTSYTCSYKFFNTLRLVPELSERGDMIPAFPLGLDTFLRNLISDTKIPHIKLAELFSNRCEIMGIFVPQCIRIFEPKPLGQATVPRDIVFGKFEDPQKISSSSAAVQNPEIFENLPDLDFPNENQQILDKNIEPAIMARPQKYHIRTKTVENVIKPSEQPVFDSGISSLYKMVYPDKEKSKNSELNSQASQFHTNKIYKNEPKYVPPELPPEIIPKLAFVTNSQQNSLQSNKNEIQIIQPKPEIPIKEEEKLLSKIASSDPDKTEELKNEQFQKIFELADFFGIEEQKPQKQEIVKEPIKTEEKKPEIFDSIAFFAQGSAPENSGNIEKPKKNIIQTILQEETEKSKITFLVDMQEVKFQKLIGAGASAEVYKGIYRATDVAIKKLKQINFDANSNILKEFKREIAVLATLRHPNLVLFMGAGRLPEGNVCILTEFCSGGTLFKLLHESIHVPLTWKQRCKIALDIAKGMSFLHSYKPPFIHRDLKSLNLLLTEPIKGINDYINVKITDFGLARYQAKDQFMTANAGTNHWMAPEICLNSNYTVKADVYSYGIVLWEIITRDLPYRGLPGPMVPYRVVYYNERPDISNLPEDCPKQVNFLR